MSTAGKRAFGIIVALALVLLVLGGITGAIGFLWGAFILWLLGAAIVVFMLRAPQAKAAKRPKRQHFAGRPMERAKTLDHYSDPPSSDKDE